MLYPAPNPVKQTTDWNFLELWVDGMVFPPRILMLVSEKNDQFSIYDPSRNYQPIFTSTTYDQAHSWLLEDDFERVDGRLLSENII